MNDKLQPTGKGIDLDKLEKKLDSILETETAESFHEWLESKRRVNTVEELANEWIDMNSHKWSNNTNEVGDNYGSFIAGWNKCKEHSYTEEQIKKAWYTLEQFDSFEDFLKKVKQSK